MASDQEIRVRLRCLPSAPRERIAEAALIGANVGLGGGFQVTPRQRNQVVAARGAQCSDHFDVVAACTAALCLLCSSSSLERSLASTGSGSMRAAMTSNSSRTA